MSVNWLIGEAPTKLNGEPFTGRSGRFLSEVVGYDVHDVFTCANVFERWPGPHSSGHGAAFPLLEAQARAKEMAKLFKPGDRVILVGRRTAKAFRVRDNLQSFQWGSLYSHTLLTLPVEAAGVGIVVIPHPSGVNRWWNVPENREYVRQWFSVQRRRILGAKT